MKLELTEKPERALNKNDAPMITVNTDTPCSKCGKGGAVKENPNGWCMGCIGKNITKNIAKQNGNQTQTLGIELFYKLELGVPDETFDIPSSVLNEEIPYEKDSGELKKYYAALLYEFTEFSYLADARIHFLWKAKGGKSGGREVWGKCKKPGGELAYYSDADYIILFSADHCFKNGLKNWQILALLYHELKHTAVDENGNFTTVGHEFEGFNDELKLFGAWNHSASEIVKTSRELPLFD
jgi:ssDNA-binding Zn-finger/Zn-ribbon topoisomerase 1